MTVVQHSSLPAIGIEDPFAQKSLNYAKFWPPCLPSVSLWPPLGNPLNAHWPSSFYGYARSLTRQYSQYQEDESYTVSETFPKKEREREGGEESRDCCLPKYSSVRWFTMIDEWVILMVLSFGVPCLKIDSNENTRGGYA